MQRLLPTTFAAAAFFGLAAMPASAAQVTIDVDSELFIISPDVVDDDRAYDGGPWSFGGLMTELAGTTPPKQFVEDWITTLVSPSVVNGDGTINGNANVAAKGAIFNNFFSAWRSRSADGTLDLDTAPFRLLAIVNRPDLVQATGGVPSSAGEARFIFAAVDPSEEDVRIASSGSRRFFVIFEYGIPAETCAELKSWHQMWHDLAQDPANPLGSAIYNDRLELITDAFTQPVTGSSALNGSLLAQLRTNEFALQSSSAIWDLREWNLVDANGDPNAAVLRNVTVKQSPAQRYMSNPNRRQDLANWLNANRTAVLDGTHVITDILPGSTRKFLGGIALNDGAAQPLPPDQQPPNGQAAGFGEQTQWWSPGFVNDASVPFTVTVEEADIRHRFALQTCAGCHGFESGTDGVVQDAVTGHTQGFSMTSVRAFGAPTKLSPFLTGTQIFTDKTNPMALDTSNRPVRVERQFDELARRVTIMERILLLDCSASTASDLADIQASTGSRVH